MSGDSLSPRHAERPRWIDGIIYPTVVALLVAGLIAMLRMHDDLTVLKVHMQMIEQRLKMHSASKQLSMTDDEDG